MPDNPQPVTPATVEPSRWTFWHTVALVALLAAVGCIGYWNAKPYPVPVYLGTVALVAAFLAVIGHGIVRLWWGVLVDDRNKMSLARLQTVLWTAVVLSGFLVAVFKNVVLGEPHPLDIKVESDLWWLLGISTASLVASPLVLSGKKNDSAVGGRAVVRGSNGYPDSTANELARQGVPAACLRAVGNVDGRTEPKDARFGDLFQGDELPNAAQVDLGKVQMFVFTLVVVGTYAIALAKALKADGAVGGLPTIDQGMTVLLGISHAGYIGNKAIPRKPETPHGGG